MKKDKFRRLFAVGLLLLSVSNLVNSLVLPMNHFILGCMSGIGLGIMLGSFYKMKQKPAC